MKQYPYAGDYQAALQSPAAAFTAPRLRKALIAEDGWGLPDAITGTSAAVFHATISGKEYALRCFTRSDASSRERYAAFDNFVSSRGLSKHVGMVTWHDHAVRVKNDTWPVLQMEWIEGRRLNDYVGYLVDEGNTGALTTLASRWFELVAELQRADFAHGDLQHGNVIIDQQGNLRLVDFDGVWIPPLRGQRPPTETGHENYQPQNLSAQARWGPWMDTFSALVVYLALIALADDPGLWLPLNNGDNMLFERKDFCVPFDTEVWKHLARVREAEVTRLVGKLREFCAPGWVATQSLADTLKLTSTAASTPTPTWWQQSARSAQAAPSTQSARSGAATGPLAEWPGAPASTASSRPAPISAPLPPPPAWPYQAKVAPPQKPAPPRSATSGWSQVPATAAGRSRSAMPTSKSGISVWWQPPAPTPAPAPPAKPPSKRAVGVACIICGIILFAALLAANLVPAAVILGLAAVGTGIGLLNAKPRKPPGRLPPPGKPPGGGSPGRT